MNFFSRALACQRTMVLAFAAAVLLYAAQAVAENLPSIKADEAARILDAVCGKSLPKFKNFEKTAKANGFKVFPPQAANFIYPYGRLYAQSLTKAAGVYVAKNEAGNLTCVVSYSSNENAPGYYRRLATVYDLGTFLKDGKTPQYRNTSAKLIIAQGTVYGRAKKGLWVGIEVPQ